MIALPTDDVTVYTQRETVECRCRVLWGRSRREILDKPQWTCPNGTGYLEVVPELHSGRHSHMFPAPRRIVSAHVLVHIYFNRRTCTHTRHRTAPTWTLSSADAFLGARLRDQRPRLFR